MLDCLPGSFADGSQRSDAEQLGSTLDKCDSGLWLEANPSFIRKLMVPLTRDGIIVSTLGRNGSIPSWSPGGEHHLARYLHYR